MESSPLVPITRHVQMRLVASTILSRLTIWAVGVYAIWQGWGIYSGGNARFNSPSFTILRQVPWNPPMFWGIALAAFGVLILTGSLLRWWWVKCTGLIGLAIWSLSFARGSAIAAEAIPTVPATGTKTYTLIAFIALVLVFVQEREMPRAA